ncbi:hypothetical protein SIID45300_01033 [Candidatus Magnetaquicoccaceae bacterium FCR-1]|uniref:Mu-like prophage protein gp29 n=1 Tax=Candidatus Magnetaquiglobus chichijimensis TaxID=3141448 RepID=A0ABQ0C766_9PROT
MSDTKRPVIQDQRPELDAIATIQNGRDITRGYVDFLPILTSQDTILRAKGASNLAIYDEVLRDDMVQSAFAQRRLALTSTEWRVEPGGTAALDRKAADSLKEILLAIDLDGVTDKMLFGVFYGFAVGECIWEVADNQVILKAIKVRKQRRFGFAPDGSLRLLTSQNPTGEPVPERKFWHFRQGADNDDEPYGLGLAHWLYWPTWFKRNGVRAWMSFLDKFAQPTVIGEYSAAASDEDKRRLLQSISSLQSQSGIIIPQGMMVRLLEMEKSGGRGDYAGLTALMNNAIARIITTQTMTLEDGSSLSQAEVHERMLNRVVRSDGNMIASSFNQSVASWLTEWNYPGARPPRLVFMTDEHEDLNRRAEREKILTEITPYRPTRKHLEEVFGGDWEEKPTQKAESDTIPPSPASGHQFAELDHPAGQQAVDAFDFGTQLQDAAAALLKPLLERLQNGLTPEELMIQLGELYPEMDYRGLMALLDQVMTAGMAWGRSDVGAE